MPTSATNTFGNAQLIPEYPHEAKAINVNLVVSVVLAQGTILGEVLINDVYTLTTGAQTTGSFTMSFNGVTTSTLAYNISAANLQIALRALSTIGSTGCTVTATGTPGTSAVYTITLLGPLATTVNPPLTANLTGLDVPGNASLTHPTISLGRGVYKAYASGNTDGSQVPKGILEFPCATDSSGNITLGTSAIGGPFGQTQKAAPMFIKGAFLCTELIGLDQNCVDAGLGRLVEGNFTTGIFRMP